MGPAGGVLGLKMAAQDVSGPIASKNDGATGLEGQKTAGKLRIWRMTRMGTGMARGPRSEVRGRVAEEPEEMVFILFSCLAAVFLPVEGPKNPICVNLRPFAVEFWRLGALGQPENGDLDRKWTQMGAGNSLGMGFLAGKQEKGHENRRGRGREL